MPEKTEYVAAKGIIVITYTGKVTIEEATKATVKAIAIQGEKQTNRVVIDTVDMTAWPSLVEMWGLVQSYPELEAPRRTRRRFGKQPRIIRTWPGFSRSCARTDATTPRSSIPGRRPRSGCCPTGKREILTCTFYASMKTQTLRRVGARGLQQGCALVGRVPPRGVHECKISGLRPKTEGRKKAEARKPSMA